jgi:hypothetical protein
VIGASRQQTSPNNAQHGNFGATGNTDSEISSLLEGYNPDRISSDFMTESDAFLNPRIRTLFVCKRCQGLLNQARLYRGGSRSLMAFRLPWKKKFLLGAVTHLVREVSI